VKDHRSSYTSRLGPIAAPFSRSSKTIETMKQLPELGEGFEVHGVLTLMR
jgi:hypothetical protein